MGIKIEYAGNLSKGLTQKEMEDLHFCLVKLGKVLNLLIQLFNLIEEKEVSFRIHRDRIGVKATFRDGENITITAYKIEDSEPTA